MIKTFVAAVAVAATAAVTNLAAPAAAGATPAPARSEGAADVRVASFNIKNVTFDSNRGASRPWSVRRDVVIQSILEEKIDVLGIQEAHPGRYLGIDYVDGPNQYLDLKRGLNKAGGTYRLTARASFNCVDAKTWKDCVERDRGASDSTRILYDAERLELVRRGSRLYRVQDGRKDRYLAWAVLRLKSTGREFLFTTTHLSAGDAKYRLGQWRHMIEIIDELKGTLPVIATGDINVQKYHPVAQKMLPAMRAAGYGDVLNQEFGVNPIRQPRAQSVVNGWVNSYNHGRKDLRTFSFFDRRDRAGNNIDWVFASNHLPVKEWKVVLDYDPVTLEVTGVLPSDHNMVRATLDLT